MDVGALRDLAAGDTYGCRVSGMGLQGLTSARCATWRREIHTVAACAAGDAYGCRVAGGRYIRLQRGRHRVAGRRGTIDVIG